MKLTRFDMVVLKCSVSDIKTQSDY